MIDSRKRLPFDFIAVFVAQFALAKYPFVLAGDQIPFDVRELVNMAVLSAVGALLIENIVYRIKNFPGHGKRK